MRRCNACANAELVKLLGKKYLRLGNSVYELDAEPRPGQDAPHAYRGRPIRFHAWFMEVAHSYDDDCALPSETKMKHAKGGG